MVRKIIKIDEEKCNGCGICASACHEGAIDIVNGKAKLVRENFCDGFGDYTEKLTEIISNNDIVSVTIVRMEVPCCGGLQRAAENAIKNSGKFLPWQVVTISRNGEVLD